MAMLRRTPAGPWEMRAIGEFHDARTVKKLVDPAAAGPSRPPTLRSAGTRRPRPVARTVS